MIKSNFLASSKFFSPRFWRNALAVAAALILMPAVVTTLHPALAISQTCNAFGAGTFTVKDSLNRDSNTFALAVGQSATLRASFNGESARTTVFTVTSGNATLSSPTGFRTTVTRTAGTAPILVRADFTDANGNQYSVTFQIN